MKSLVESLFDDHIKSPLKIHGVEIKYNIWSECERYFDRIKKDLKGKKEYEDPWNKSVYKIDYYGDDCIILSDTLVSYDSWMYIICTEAIYMNYMAAWVAGDRISISHLEEYGKGFDESYLNLAFATKISKYTKEWYPLEGCDTMVGWKKVLDANLPVRSYCPETISPKAQKIIKNCMK